ncbi:tyrosine-type recombinase/integrase [Roseburia sp. MSJ-14]|uniref:tyrosine-type recombinase/integrase n=1 Tax=Roseburia sp. MSJ-14 TaxID=2841514 RepID=UPI001C11AE49|nr:tyrosine-type recombinase/integrase [Roseburia sp. MSJ-14]MBU5472757.1 tyrosine-type recombinase/integrase [Roseburia sp. MSJ-14]
MEYTEKINLENKKKLQELLKELPKFCSDFFRYLDTRNTSSRTRLSYGYDIRIFFEFIQENNPVYKKMSMHDIPISVLDEMTPIDIEEYLSYLSYYEKSDGQAVTNGEKGKSRKLSAIRTMYNYYFKKEFIKTNAPSMIDTPKKHKENIIRLDKDEVADLITTVQNGENLTARQLAAHQKTKYRDIAILTLLLGTGIRVSECVGLDVADVSFKNNCMRVVRKGGNESTIYFGDEVADALLDYLELEREGLAQKATPEHENALFLSLKYSRLTTRSVEKLVKKYTGAANINKKITPHKLRSTYGTNLYKETGDIYLVADALGHKSVETTRQHYAAIDDDRRRLAGKFSGSIFHEDE